MSQGYIPPNQPEPQRRRRSAAPQQQQPFNAPPPPQPAPVYQQPMQPAMQHQGYVQQPQSGTTCPRCGSNRINISMVQTAASTRNRGRGCLWGLMRLFLIIITAGLWLLIGKSKGKSRTRIQSEKTAICQNCGNSWAM